MKPSTNFRTSVVWSCWNTRISWKYFKEMFRIILRNCSFLWIVIYILLCNVHYSTPQKNIMHAYLHQENCPTMQVPCSQSILAPKIYSLLQLISRNFGHASCEIGWEFGNYKHKIIKLIGNQPIKFGSFASNYRNSLWNSEPSSQASLQIANDFDGKF
jgi:hypothetical protein